MKVSNQIVMNPRGVAATAIVAAASRAGARGFLNTDGYDSHAAIQTDARAVIDVTENPIGMRLTPSTAKWITELTSSLTSQWQWAIVSEADWSDWPRWIEALQRLGIEIVVEVVSPSQFKIWYLSDWYVRYFGWYRGWGIKLSTKNFSESINS